ALGSSTTVKGEIKNDSRENISSALFGLKVLGKDGKVIHETSFSIISLKSNGIKSFDQLITGIHPSQISGYEIAFKQQ
ncbi:MAG: FxLYD domain-containing protein, partial [Candidatus Scalindua sp.]|nr:FxLYD domain-containing protein [Candidatus Scalindua sp.]MCR4344444.1 FxLYD domain-containing protein [Candidatus Scalindua sp.]